MVEETALIEKEERKARRNTRLLWVIIILDILLFGYIAYEVVRLVISLLAK